MTLRTRLTAIYTAAAALLVAAVAVVVVTALRAGLTGNLDAALRSRASDVVTQLAARDGPVAVEAVNGIVVQVLDARGRVLDGSDVVGSRALVGAGILRSARRHDVVADRALPASEGGRIFRTLTTRAGSPDGRWTVVVAADRSVVDGPVGRTERLLVAVSAVLVGAAGLGSWLQARAALRAVEHMRAQADAMTVTGAGRGIEVPASRDELARLAATFNDLLRRLHAALERERAFVADAGHELRTPLTVLRGELELGSRPGRSAVELRGTVLTARRQTERLARMAEGLLNLIDPGGAVEQFDLVLLVEQAAQLCRGEAHDGGVTIRVHGSVPMSAAGDEAALHRVVVNLITNAIRHAPRGSSVDAVAESSDGGWRVIVRDRGSGFPPEFLDRAFDRFSQADPSRHRGRDGGAGLGLAIVAATMQSHGGTAVAVNRPDGGAEVSVSWPRSSGTRS